LVAVTKKDLVDEDWLELVTADVEDVLKDTTLEGARIVTTSSVTKDGLPELMAAIDELLAETPSKRDVGRPRLPVDRSFTMSGFGTVVTGTLIDGQLSVGQEVELVLSGESTRIRGLQTHRTKLENASPGSRVAANLTGVSQEAIARGEVLATPGWLTPTTAMDVRLRVIPEAPHQLRHNMFLTVHTGSSEEVARLRLLESDTVAPGQTTWAQLKLNSPLAVVKGDYFVVRSNQTTLGGGEVVDPRARRHRRRHQPILERLEVMQEGSGRDVLVKTIEASEPCEFGVLVNKANLEPDDARSLLESMVSENAVVILGKGNIGRGTSVYTAAGWAALGEKARDALSAYHRQFPLRKGAPKEELRSRLKMAQQVFNNALPRLEEDGVVAEEGALVRLPDHTPQLSGTQSDAAAGYLRRLEADPYSPPTDAPIDAEVLNVLVEEGKVVKVSESVVFSTSAYQEMVDRILAYIREHGEISVADVRDMFGASRKYALPLMDYLDHQRITRRVGDVRVLR